MRVTFWCSNCPTIVRVESERPLPVHRGEKTQCGTCWPGACPSCHFGLRAVDELQAAGEVPAFQPVDELREHRIWSRRHGEEVPVDADGYPVRGPYYG